SRTHSVRLAKPMPQAEAHPEKAVAKRSHSSRAALWILLFVLPAVSSCTPTALLNATAATSTLTAPFGAPVPRTLRVSFINNTAFRAIFTFGSYDPLDKTTSPTNFGQLRLEAGVTSATQNQPCRKVFSVGGDELIRLITVNNLTVNDQRALIKGV